MSIQNNFPAIKPTLLLDFANTEALDSRITYTRATTATYYDGKTTAKAEENLCTYSQLIGGTNWSGNLSGVTNSVTAPDGTITASNVTMQANLSSFFYNTFATVVSGLTYTVSVYAKSAGAVPFRLVTFNTAQQNSGNITTTSTWTRYTWTFTASSASAIGTGLQSDSVAGDIQFWGFQLEQRSTATAYTPTTTQPITNYIPVLLTALSGTPRFDHNPVTGESLGLLIEEQRTNLLTYSEQFDNAVWQKQNVTVAANTTVAPDGTLTADTLTPAAANSFAYQVFSAAAATYTFSIWIKAASVGTSLELNLYTNTGASSVAAAVVTTTGSWQRVSVTGTYASASASAWATIGGNASFSTGETLYIWGAQLEAGAFATSYIPTVASQVTRAADAASMTGANFSSWYTQGPGTFYIDLNSIGTTNSKFAGVFLYSSDNSALHSVANSGNNSAYTYTTGFALQVFLATTLTAPAKLAYAYETNNFALASNGTLAGVDGLGNLPILNKLLIGWNQVDNQGAVSTIKKIAYYPIRCTNTQLQALTS
jgi:hypothetical protein